MGKLFGQEEDRRRYEKVISVHIDWGQATADLEDLYGNRSDLEDIWDLENTSGFTVSEISGNENDLTIQFTEPITVNQVGETLFLGEYYGE